MIHYQVAANDESALLSTLRDAAAIQRPALIHLNADTSWLVQIPRPERERDPVGRSHFNILVDPWLRGPQSDVAFWFSIQWHATKSSVQSIAQLNDILHTVQTGHKSLKNTSESRSKAPNFIDAIVVSHEFTDHCHKRTLLEIDPTTPVFATSKAALIIKSWRHFKTVIEPTPFSTEQHNWTATSSSALPAWMGISRIVGQSDSLYYHSAIMITFNLDCRSASGPRGECVAEALVYTPHGIRANDLECLKVADPPLKTLALMHGLHDVKISRKQLNLGAHNGLQVQRVCRAKYWVSTHDEVKKARGLITPILSRKVLTMKDALEEERRHNRNELTDESSALSVVKDVHFAELKSGESIMLE